MYLCFQVSVTAVVFRQTNIVWIVFIAGTAFLRNTKNTSISPLSLGGILTLFSLLAQLWPYVLVGLTFALFLVWNGSVVVGDRTHHQMHLHFPQIFYFVTFSLFFSLPFLFGNVRLFTAFVRKLRKKVVVFGVVAVLCCALVAVHYFT